MGVLDTNTRYAMAKFAGDGATTDYDINFEGGWINKSDVIAYHMILGDSSDIVQLGLTWLSMNPNGHAGRVRVSAPVPPGRTLYIVRQTQRADPLVDFVNRSMLTEANLNIITQQAIYSVAEMEDSFDELDEQVGGAADLAVATANAAVVTANEAKDTAGNALARANDAYDKGVAAEAGIAAATAAANSAQAAAISANAAASDAIVLVNSVQGEVNAAIATANAASANANAASDAANAISGKADAALLAANEAKTDAEGAVTTANAAKATADGVDAKATEALTKATDANTAVQNKLSRTDTASQTVAGPVVWSSDQWTQVASGAVDRSVWRGITPDGSTLAFHRLAKSGSDTTYQIGARLGTGSEASDNVVKAAVSFSSTGAVSVLGSNVDIDAPATVRGVLTSNNYHQIYTGATGQLTGLTRFGWATGAQANVRRWGHALESDGSLSLYGYDSASGTPRKTFNMRTSETVGGTGTGVATELFMGGDSSVRVGNTSFAPGTGKAALYTYGPNGGGLHMQDGGNWLQLWTGTGTQAVITINNGTVLNATTSVCYAPAFQATSDIRLKRALAPVDPVKALLLLKQITPHTGRYKAWANPDTRERYFLIAQDVEKRFPSMVNEAYELRAGEGAVKTVDYDQMVPVLVAAVQALSHKIDVLEKQLNER